MNKSFLITMSIVLLFGCPYSSPSNSTRTSQGAVGSPQTATALTPSALQSQVSSEVKSSATPLGCNTIVNNAICKLTDAVSILLDTADTVRKPDGYELMKVGDQFMVFRPKVINVTLSTSEHLNEVMSRFKLTLITDLSKYAAANSAHSYVMGIDESVGVNDIDWKGISAFIPQGQYVFYSFIGLKQFAVTIDMIKERGNLGIIASELDIVSFPPESPPSLGPI